MTLLYDWLKDAADSRGNNKALVYRDNYLSWRGLLHRVDRRAQEFKAMGLKKGCWVGLMLGNVPDFVILALALSKLDVTIVPIDPTTATRELDLMLEAAPLRAMQKSAAAGMRHAIVDAITDEHLFAIGAAGADLKLLTGGSGLALGLPENFRRQQLLKSVHPRCASARPRRGTARPRRA